MTINELKFGNLNKRDLAYLKEENYLDSLFNELANHPNPTNDSEETQRELVSIVSFIDILSKNAELLHRYLDYDKSIEDYLTKILEKTDILSFDLSSILKDVFKDATPLLIKVKNHYQRIRPQQIAYFAKCELNPFQSVSTDSPSYPSGHAYYAKLYCEVLGNRYPKYYKQLQEISNDMAWSRISMGVGFPSDSDFGIYMADCVLAHPDFKKKYKL